MEACSHYYKEAGGLSKSYVSSCPLPKFSLWEKIKNKRTVISFDLELTARCNLDCRHCYINVPAEVDTNAYNKPPVFAGEPTIVS